MRLTLRILVLVGLFASPILAQLSDNPALTQNPTPTSTMDSTPYSNDPNSYPTATSDPNDGHVNNFAQMKSETKMTAGGKTRKYYIQIGTYNWDYTPSQMDLFHGGNIGKGPSATWFSKSSKTIGSKYLKALYRAYTDSTFKTPIPHEPYLGMLGPIIRAEVGDKIEILVSNQSPFNCSMHPHGVKYSISNEGALYEGAAMGAIVSPGGKYTYQWDVPARAGPGPNDPDSVNWAYHSHVQDASDIYAGLTGPIIIYKKGTLGANGLPKTVDREFVLQYLVSDENSSPYLQMNIKAAKIKQSAVGTPEFEESNMMHNINGYSFNNVPGLTMNIGDRVRWYFMAFGNEVDLHSASFHGNSLLQDGYRVDTIELIPAIFRSADMVPDALGQWLIECHTIDHFNAGMIGSYSVVKSKTPKKASTTSKKSKAHTTSSGSGY